MLSENNEIVVELEINCPREKAWLILMTQMPAWFPQDFLCTDAPHITFEPFAGGRLYEESPSGSQILWGHVLMIAPGKTLDFAGSIMPAYGGPSVNYTSVNLSDTEDGKTKFRMVNSVLGKFAPETEENTTEGWNYLWNSFKSFCEQA